MLVLNTLIKTIEKNFNIEENEFEGTQRPNLVLKYKKYSYTFFMIAL